MTVPIDPDPEPSRAELVARIRELESKLEGVASVSSLPHVMLEAQLKSMRDAQLSMEEARDCYAALYDDAPVCYFTLDRHGIIHNLNLTAARLLGAERKSIVGRPFSAWVCNADKPAFFSHLAAASAGHCERSEAEVRLSLPKDKMITVTLESVYAGELADGKLALQTVAIDVTLRKQAESALQAMYQNIEQQVRLRTEQLSDANRELRESQLRERALLDSSPDFAWLKDRNGNYVAINKAFADHFRLSPENLIGKDDTAIWDEATSAKCRADEMAILASGQPLRVEEQLIGRDGKSMFVETIKVPIIDRKKVVGTAGVARDVSERKAAQERIHYLAHYDTLTGLPNRALLNERFDLALASAHRNAEQIAVLFIDLDRFKAVNDGYGHRVGDLLLAEVAERLKKCVREVDTVARFGGDEFIVVTSQLNHAADAGWIAEKMLRSLGEPYNLLGNELNISPSIGISLYPRDAVDKEILVRLADTAMYHAKKAGRNNFQFFDPDMDVLDSQRSAIENRLQRALASGQLTLNYQPIVDASSGKIVGCEALLRLQHEGITIAPSEFISIAEESGMIFSIGAWVLQTACRQNRTWQEAGLPSIPISVNLSGIQFRQTGLVDAVALVLSETGLPPHFLELELTETTIMNTSAATMHCLDQLKELGVRISIDDFGTGYSSLSYLQNFPIDKLKIDQSFVRGIGAGTKNTALTGAIIMMAKLLDIAVTAEGVETADQLSTLQAQGCDYVQGYHCGIPMEAAAFAESLSRNAGMHAAPLG